MKRLFVVAAAALGLLGVGTLIAPSAHAATTCSGIKVHLSASGSDVINLCLPDDLGL
jgi:hypothetical protein